MWTFRPAMMETVPWRMYSNSRRVRCAGVVPPPEARVGGRSVPLIPARVGGAGPDALRPGYERIGRSRPLPEVTSGRGPGAGG
ncbi:hypothetical protein ACMATS_36980 [Streptoverticillium reticulum]|uniref:hypothetical protein n=1 Tax=Streptoverticillium reticulum TaxID=1433415 RepID=UPI0039BED31E